MIQFQYTEKEPTLAECIQDTFDEVMDYMLGLFALASVIILFSIFMQIVAIQSNTAQLKEENRIANIKMELLDYKIKLATDTLKSL